MTGTRESWSVEIMILTKKWKISKTLHMHQKTSRDLLACPWWLLDMSWVSKTCFWESSFFIIFDQFWVKWRPGRHRYATDGDIGLENSASPSKIIRVETLRSQFGLDLTYENLGQRVMGTPYWRGGMDSEFGPLEESASHHFWPVLSSDDQVAIGTPQMETWDLKIRNPRQKSRGCKL